MIFLDTPREGILDEFMPLLSHDKYEIEYQYVDSSDKTGFKTKTNVLTGWPAVIFAQAIDYTRHPRYQEIQRRFIVTNPKMTFDKYDGAVNLILEKSCNPDFVYQKKVVCDKDKDIAKEIILNIIDDIKSFIFTTRPGKSNTLNPFHHLISEKLSKNTTAHDMTFASRLTNLIELMTIINHKKRPYMEIKSAFEEESFRVPMSLYSDFKEAFALINNSPGGLRPYILDWYNNVFLKLYKSKSQPNSKIEKEGRETIEQKIAVTTQELIEKTKEVMNKTYTKKSILQEFIYPLSNLGYIDSIQSELDKRAKIYFPAINLLNEKEEKNSNLFLLGEKNNLLDENNSNDIKFILNKVKSQIISKIEEVMRYSSESGNLTTLRFADSDSDILKEDYNIDKTVEEIVDRYYSEFMMKDVLKFNDDKIQNVSSKTSSSEEYLQTVKNDDILQQNQENNMKYNEFNDGSSNKLFLFRKKE